MTSYDIIIGMPEETDIVKIFPETFPECKKCQAALSMIAQLISSSQNKISHNNGPLVAEVKCKFLNNLSTGAQISSKIHPIPIENNLNYWAYYPRITNVKCPVFEQRNK